LVSLRIYSLDKKYHISIPGYGMNQKEGAAKGKALAKSAGAQSHAARLQEVKDARIRGKGRR
jgi:hypothetical protein